MGAAPSNALTTPANGLRPRSSILMHGVKAFEKSVFGPCTLGRTWGTRPEPRTVFGSSKFIGRIRDSDQTPPTHSFASDFGIWQRCQISRLFHEDAQGAQVINFSILPRCPEGTHPPDAAKSTTRHQIF